MLKTAMSKQLIVICQLISVLSSTTIKQSEVLKDRSHISQSDACNRMYLFGKVYTFYVISFNIQYLVYILSFEEKQKL